MRDDIICNKFRVNGSLERWPNLKPVGADNRVYYFGDRWYFSTLTYGWNNVSFSFCRIFFNKRYSLSFAIQYTLNNSNLRLFQCHKYNTKSNKFRFSSARKFEMFFFFYKKCSMTWSSDSMGSRRNKTLTDLHFNMDIHT